MSRFAGVSEAGARKRNPERSKTITTKIGEATVTEIDPDSATLSFNGTGPVKVGDIAKTPQQ